MNGAQLTIIILIALDVGVAIAEHGKPRTPRSFWMSVISAAIFVGILCWGGFFDGMFAP